MNLFLKSWIISIMMMIFILVNLFDSVVDSGPKFRNELFRFFWYSFYLIFLVIDILVIGTLFYHLGIKWWLDLWVFEHIRFNMRGIILIFLLDLIGFFYLNRFLSIDSFVNIFLLHVLFPLDILLKELILMLKLLNVLFKLLHFFIHLFI